MASIKKIRILTSLLLFYIPTFGQISSGYFENVDNDNNIIDRLIISDCNFQQYFFFDNKVIYGQGKIKIEDEKIHFKYERIDPYRFYAINVHQYQDKLDTIGRILVKVDSSKFHGYFDKCSYYLVRNLNDSVSFDSIISYTPNPTVYVKPFIKIKNEFIDYSLAINNYKTNFDITIILDNCSNINIDPQVLEYKIITINKNKMTLMDNKNVIIEYRKNRKNKKDFLEYLQSKKEIEIPF